LAGSTFSLLSGTGPCGEARSHSAREALLLLQRRVRPCGLWNCS